MTAEVLKRTWLLGAAILAGFVSTPVRAFCQTSLDSFQVYTEHPRIFLRAPRLRLLRRERERNSMRWDQFNTVIAGGADMPEPGFAYALFAQIAGDPAYTRRALDWAAAPGRDLRQTALVFDWCYAQMTPVDKQTLTERLRTGLQTPAATIPELRSHVLAAIALAGDDDAASAAALRDFVRDRWLGQIASGLEAGRPVIHGSDTYALWEIFHAFRDNLNTDLRENARDFFRELPLFDLLSYYPAPFPAPENEFHIPFAPGSGEPDLRAAALSRAGELAMVALDTNAPTSQVLQGWLMNDHFLMRGPFGIPYEFLWANPYQPGLSYYHVPLVVHDALLGRLIVRSSWEDSARWAAYIDGQLQEFVDGRVVPLDTTRPREPLDLDEAEIFFSPRARKLRAGQHAANDIFIVGLDPRAAFDLEVDDEEMRESTSDPGGILYLKGVRAGAGIRFNPESNAPDPPAALDR